MAKSLSTTINNQISNKRIKKEHIFYIESTDYSSYLLGWTISNDIEFGSASATFTLNNDNGLFGEGGANTINVGDTVEFYERFGGDSIEWKRFYGKVEQRSITKTETSRTIVLNCLDWISVLQQWDIDLEQEGTKVQVRNETLTPNYLDSPNDEFAQIFDFANNAIATDPAPILLIRNKNDTTDEDPQYDGFDILYDEGQVKLGAPLNALYNYDLIARSYYYYTHGLHVEDILEDILTEPDGYGKYLFGETTAQDVIDNHLTTTFYTEEGTNTDTLIPNLSATTIVIETTLTAGVTAGATSISVASTNGFPTSGSGSINGDNFTWTGKTANTLTGIPSTGSNALRAHNSGDYVEYSASYAIGRVWYLSYSNVSTTLTASDFSIGGGGTFSYFDKRNGRIILTGAIAVGSVVICNSNYTFKTLQATGVELNKISFRSREVENRYEAINKLRQYLAPNYIIRTQGDNKIWATYLSQKTSADYTVNLVQGINYLEDEDLYTRVKFFGKNKNPTNLMFNEDVEFVTTGQTYTATATQNELSYVETENGWHIYESLISGAGYINADTIVPTLYIDNIPVNNTRHQEIMQPIQVVLTTRTETTAKTGWKYLGNEKVTVATYYRYDVYFPHQNIDPSQTIYLYDASGTELLTIVPGTGDMDYGRGVYYGAWGAQNSTMSSLSTASYFIFYSTNDIEIDYDNIRFKINSKILPNPSEAEVTATFEYWTIFTPCYGAGALVDGRWDTQIQTEFFSEPPAGYNYAILDLGALKTIQAIDLTAGFYKPDEIRKFDVDMRLTLHYSTDNISYYNISDATHNFRLTGGESISFEEKDLGIGFQARYIKIILEDVKKIDFGDGVYPVAFTELSIYDDIILSSESSLIATTALTQALTNLFDTPPLAHYLMNDNDASTTVVDASNYKNHGTAARNTNLLSTAGKISGALTHNGSSDKVDLGNPSHLQLSNAVSVSLWFKADVLGDWDCLFGKMNAGNSQGYALRYRTATSELRFSINGQEASIIFTDTTAWHHIVGTYDGATVRIYIDGVAGTSRGYAGSIIDSGTNAFIGWTSGFSYFQGKIDDVRIYSYALSQDEVDAIYNAGSGTEEDFLEILSVGSTYGFTVPESGQTDTAYLGSTPFTYRGVTSTSFTGCVVESGASGAIGDRVSQTLETDTTLYDDDGLLEKLGDRLYKELRISDEYLYTQSQLDGLTKDYLEEFYKNHTKNIVSSVFAPYMKMGQTVLLVDSYNDTNANHFISSISDDNGMYRLVLARYP